MNLYLLLYFFFLNFSLVIQNQTGYLLRRNVMLLSIGVECKVHLHWILVHWLIKWGPRPNARWSGWTSWLSGCWSCYITLWGTLPLCLWLVARHSLSFLISLCLHCIVNKNEDTDFSEGPSSSKFLGREFQHWREQKFPQEYWHYW